MFTIDLLKGQGIPIKSKPAGIAVTAGTIVVPIIIGTVMLGIYLHTRVVVSVLKQEVTNYEAKIAKFSEAVTLQKAFEEEKNFISSCLSEVSSSIGRRSQWSPVLESLVTNLPNSVVLTEFEVKPGSIRKKVPKKDNPKSLVEANVPIDVLHMTVSGSPHSDFYGVVKEFRDRLRFSTVLGPKLEDIRVSQKVVKLEDQDVVSYDIDCIFKPKL